MSASPEESGKAAVVGAAVAAASSSSTVAVEFEPPLACVRRILKNAIPSANVGKDASAAFARACGIFVIYVTACANDFCRENKRQTITANDILAAIKELDFDEFTPELQEFLTYYRDSEKSKKEAKAKGSHKSKGAAAAKEDAAENDSVKESPPPAKKPRLEDPAIAAVPATEQPSDTDDKSLEKVESGKSKVPKNQVADVAAEDTNEESEPEDETKLMEE